MNFVEMPIQAIEPRLSAEGYMFTNGFKACGKLFYEYTNPKLKKRIQLELDVRGNNYYCKSVNEEEYEE